jgi:hypothetical protein
LFNFFKLNAQTYNYSYSDPCTGNIKTIVVPINGNVTVGYYGEIGSFSQNDFTNGTFDAWTNNIFSQYGTNSPCSEIVGLGTAINVTQGTALNVIGILNSLSSISDLSSGSTNILGGSVSSLSNGGSGNKNKKGNNPQNGSGSNTTNTNNSTTNNTQNQTNGTSNSTQGGSTTSGSNEGTTNGGNGTTNQNVGTQNPTQAGGTTTEGGSNETGTQSSESSVGGQIGGQIGGQTTTENGNSNNSGVGTTGNNGGNGGTGSGSGNNQTQETQTTEEGGGQTNITGGATTTIKSTPSSKEGGKPTIVANGDFVGFNFRNSDVRTGLKLTGGYTAMRWDGKRSSGCLVDYTSALRGPNITGFYAFIRSKSIIIGSGTLTVGFEGNKSLYGTIAVGQMFTFKKPKSLKLIYMGTVSYGQVYRESFLGTALIVGATYDMKIGKRLDIKLMNLMVYAPYVSYYNDVVLKSPYVMLPSIGTNIKITKKFKFNINAGGAWDLKTSALNYTVTCGARMLVGQ